MLGRGVLAEPGCVFECAKVLGMPAGGRKAFLCGDDRDAWLIILRELTRRSRLLGESEMRSIARIKQWLNYARHRGVVTWFDHVKRLLSVDEIFSALEHAASAASQNVEALSA
jgi:hypothetical protein